MFESRFNGEEVHAAARRYLQQNQLVLPLSRMVVTNGFRAVADSTLSYRQAGSFVLFLIDRYQLETVLRFFRTSQVSDGQAAIRSQFASVFGSSLEDVEAAWLSMLRGPA